MRAKPRNQPTKDDTVDVPADILEGLETTSQPTRKQRIANIRDLRLRKIEADTTVSTLKSETEVQKLQSQTGLSGGSPSASPATALIMMLAAQGLEPEKANAYIKALDNESIMKLSMIGSRDSNALLPLILLGGKQGTSLEDIVKVVGAIIAIAKPASGDETMVTKLVTETIPNLYKEVASSKDIAYTSQIALLRQELAEAKPKNPMEYVKDVAEAAAALGMRAGAEVSLEVEKLRLEDAREVRRIQADKENTTAILGTVEKIIEGPAGQVISKLGEAGADRIRTGKGTYLQGGPPSSPEMVMAQCGRCGGTFPVRKDAKMVKCPHCGTDLPVEIQQSAPPQERREAELPRVPDFGGGGDELTPRWSGPPEKE